MINPGIENNPVFPTSSGQGGPPNMSKLFGSQLVAIDGFSVTLGIVLIMIVAYWVWATMLRRRR